MLHGQLSEMKQAEYTEGIKATQNFEEGMKALFKVPKAEILKREKRKAKQRKTASVRKSKRADKD